jgi:hypothetical protein
VGSLDSTKLLSKKGWADAVSVCEDRARENWNIGSAVKIKNKRREGDVDGNT